MKLNLPPSYLLIHRVWLGGIGVLCQLGGTVPAREIVVEHMPGMQLRHLPPPVRLTARPRRLRGGAGSPPGGCRACPRCCAGARGCSGRRSRPRGRSRSPGVQVRRGEGRVVRRPRRRWRSTGGGRAGSATAQPPVPASSLPGRRPWRLLGRRLGGLLELAHLGQRLGVDDVGHRAVGAVLGIRADGLLPAGRLVTRAACRPAPRRSAPSGRRSPGSALSRASRSAGVRRLLPDRSARPPYWSRTTAASCCTRPAIERP